MLGKYALWVHPYSFKLSEVLDLSGEKLQIVLWFDALTMPRRPNVNPMERKQPLLIKTDNIKRSAADTFWRTRPCVCGATLFTCHDGWGAFIWRGWNHNVGMQKIAARKQQPDYEAPEVSAGMRWAFSLVVKVWMYHRLSGARRQTINLERALPRTVKAKMETKAKWKESFFRKVAKQ